MNSSREGIQVTIAGEMMGAKQELWASELLPMLEVRTSKEVERTYYDYGELFFDAFTPTRVETIFNDSCMAVFSETLEDCQFPNVDLTSFFDHNVFLYLNPDIWKIHNEPLRWNKRSGKKCVACGQLRTEKGAYGCWINIMSGCGKVEEWDTEHTHRHDELLIQLFGRLSWALLPKLDKDIHVLWPGDALILPARRKHVLDTYNSRDAESVFISIGYMSDMKCPCQKLEPNKAHQRTR